MKKLVIGSLALIASGSVVAEGTPWLGVPGDTSVNVSYVDQSADQFYVGGTIMTLPAELEQQTTWLSISHVLSDDIAVDAKIGYAKSDFIAGSDSGISDSTVGVTWRLYDEFLMDSSTPSVAVRAAIILAGDYDEGQVFSVGDGANGAEVSLLLGKSFGGMFAASAEVGYRYRDSGVDNDLFVNFNTYFQLSDSFSAGLGYHMVDAQGDINIGTTPDFTQVAEESELADINVTYRLNDQLSFTLSHAEVLDGENTSDSSITAFTVGYTF